MKRFDRVWETTTTTGTGSYVLAGAKSEKYRAFGDPGVLEDGDYTEYFATDGTDWERGWGKYTTATTTLTRNLIESSTGSLIDWGSGTKDVFIAPPAASLNDISGIYVGTSRPAWLPANRLWFHTDGDPPGLYWFTGASDLLLIAINGGVEASAPGRLLRVTKYEASDTWTLGDDVGAIFVQVQAPGGGGGGADGGSSQSGAGGGGGGGGYSEKLIFRDDLNDTETITIGAPGTGGAAGNNPGGDGGTTSFGAHLSATGGGGGGSMSAGTSVSGATGGAGGSGTGGTLNVTGDAGTRALRIDGSFASAGSGGAAHLGGGATEPIANTEGNAGGQYGGGGSGGRSNNTTDRAGGAGGPGVVIVWEFSR